MNLPDGSVVRMSEVFVDNILKPKYGIGDIVVRRVHTRTAKEIYDMLNMHKHMSVEDIMRMIFRNTQSNLLYSKDLSSNIECYCTVNFDEFGYIEEIIPQGIWNPEYKLKWEVRDESSTYAGAKHTTNGTWGQEFLIGMKYLKLMSEVEIKNDILGNAWKFLPGLDAPVGTNSASSAFTNNITIHHKIK